MSSNISFYNVLGHTYLLSRPYVYNGGLLGQILSNLYIADASTNLNVSLNANLDLSGYLISFFFNVSSQVPSFNSSSISYSSIPSNNLSTSIIGILYVVFLFFSCLVAGFIWTCVRIFKHNLGCKICKKRIKYFCCSISEKQKDIIIKEEKERKKEQKRFSDIMVSLCTICIVFLLFCIVCFIFSLTSQVSLQQQMMSSSSNSSFYSSWVNSSSELNTFINRMTNESYFIFNNSIGNMSYSLQNVLYGSIRNVTSDLLAILGIYDIFNGANSLVVNLGLISQSMQYINNNINSTLAQINYQTGFVQATTNLLTISMKRVCNTLPQNSQCFNFLNNLSQFQVVINPANINADSSVAMLFLLNQMQLNITSVAITIASIQTNFNNDIIYQTDQKVQSLNLDASVNQITTVWPYIYQSFSSWENNFAYLNSSILQYLNIYGLGLFITTCVLLFLVAVVLILYTIALIRYSLLHFLQKQMLINLAKEAPIDYIFSLEHEITKRRIHRLKNTYSINPFVIYCYLIVTSFIILFILILSLLITNASHLVYNEACVQIWHSAGLTTSDNFLDVFLNTHWSALTSYILSKNSPIQFIFPQPTHILSNIRNKCTQNNGLFYALQMTNFVNVSSFLWSPQNLMSLNSGLNITYSLLLGMNVAQVIPTNMNSLLNSASSISVYFDSVNYQPTINELNKGVIGLQNYSTWISSAIQFFSTINSRDSNETIDLLTSLSSDVTKLQSLETSVVNLRNNFQIIQAQRMTTKYINTLIFNISTVTSTLVDSPYLYNIVRNVYFERMQTQFPKDADASLNSLMVVMISRLFPCVNLAAAGNILLNNLCAADSTIEKTASYGLNIAITCGCFMVMLHLLWMVIRKDFEEEEEKNVSSC